MNEFMEKMHELVEIYKNKENKRKIEDFDYYAFETNVPCGDEMSVYLKTEGDKITDASFLGKGCIISQVGGSLLTKHLIGKDIKEIETMNEEKIKKMLDIELSPTRMKCATLCLRTARKAVEKRFLLNILPSENGNVIAIIDKNIKDKVFENEKMKLDLTSRFYDGKEATFKEIKYALKEFYTANIVGNDIVNALKEMNIIHEENVKEVGGCKFIHLYTID